MKIVLRIGCSLLLLAAMACSGWAVLLLAQSQQEPRKESQKDQEKKKAESKPEQQQKDNKPAPLFGGSLNLKSSRQTKDTATLGFNGIDPNGQVQKRYLDSTPTRADQQRAQQLAGYRVEQSELLAFIQDGKLNAEAAPKPAPKK